MRVQRTHTKQLRAPLTTTLGHPKSTQCNFNSCSFNYKSDYIAYFNQPTTVNLCGVSDSHAPEMLTKSVVRIPLVQIC